MPRPKTILPLVEKIAQAFEAVGKLPRAGKNTARDYPYTRATDVFEAVRLELFRGHAAELAQVKQKYFKDLFRWASDGKGTAAAPKLTAVPAQEALPLRAAREPIQMKIGAKSIEFEPKEKGYAL